MNLVSIIIPTRNRPHALPVALRSALAQTYEPLEIVVVDDASTPPAAVPDDPRIRLIRLEQRRGGAGAKNEGMRQARGAYLSFLDDDDVYLPEKSAMQARFLDEHPEVDLVFSQVITRNADGSHGFRLRDDYVHDPVANLRLYNVIHTDAALFRRSVAERVQFDERLTRFTDTQFFLAAALVCRAEFLPGDVAVWHQHSDGERMTEPDLLSTCRNFRLLCSIFDDVLAAHPDIRRDYHASLDALETRALKALF